MFDDIHIATYGHTRREDFDRFVEGKDVAAVKAYAESSRTMGDARTAALEWLARQEQKDAEVLLQLRMREIAAAETSAQAADRSARWARVAVLISIAALAVAAWPFIKDQLT